MTAPEGLRERIAEALHRQQNTMARGTPPHGYYEMADAVLDALGPLVPTDECERLIALASKKAAETALDALRLEQVGRQCVRHGQSCPSRCGEPMEPVFVLRKGPE